MKTLQFALIWLAFSSTAGALAAAITVFNPHL